MKRIRTAALAAVLGLVSVTAAHAAIESPIHRNFNVHAGGTIIIDADIGDIKVTSGASNVSVDVIRRAKTSSREHADELFKDFEITFAQEQNDVRIRARYNHPTSWFHWNTDLDVRFVVNVPAQYNVDLTTSGGDIVVSDLAGQVRVKTSGGDVVTRTNQWPRRRAHVGRRHFVVRLTRPGDALHIRRRHQSRRCQPAR